MVALVAILLLGSFLSSSANGASLPSDAGADSSEFNLGLADDLQPRSDPYADYKGVFPDSFLDRQREAHYAYKRNTQLESVAGGGEYWPDTDYRNQSYHARVEEKRKRSVEKRGLAEFLGFRPPVRLEDRRREALEKCLLDQRLPVVLKADKDWGEYARPYNARFDWEPDAITTPKTANEVALSLNCARINKVKAQARAGGHSYAAFSNGGKDGSLVVDLRRMDEVKWKGDNVTAGGGMRLGNLALELARKGRAVPHGDCPAVGLTGHSLHGGFGYTSRKWGLSTDAITELEVVTSDGTVRTANRDRNTDLFWALRGAADSIGIVTKVTLGTEKAPTDVHHFEFDLSGYWTDRNRRRPDTTNMARALNSLRNTLQTNPAIDGNFGLTVRLRKPSAAGAPYRPSFSVSGYHYGSQKKAIDAADVMSKSMGGAPATVETMKWVEALAKIANTVPLAQPRDQEGTGSNFFVKALLAPNSEPLTEDGLREWLDYVTKEGRRLAGGWLFVFRLLGGLGSQINAVSRRDAPVNGRRAMWVIQMDGETVNQEERMINFITESHQLLKDVHPQVKFKAFAPFLDSSLNRRESHKQYFSGNSYEKLKVIKGEYDPTDTFWNPQSVPLPREKRGSGRGGRP